MYPLKNMWITCKPGEYAHKYSKAIDDQGFDYKSIDKVYAPYTGKVVRKYPSECEIWFESIDKVEFADGTIDYATMLLAHKDRYDDIRENSIYKQGEVIYSEGTKAGNKVGAAQRHVHIEMCKGITKNPGWKKASDGTWNLENAKNPTDCFFVDNSINIINSNGLKFKKISNSEVKRDENVNQLKVIVRELRIRINHTTNSKIVDFAAFNGIYNDLETYNDGTYIWHKINDNEWIATKSDWVILFPKTDYKKNYEDSLAKISELEKKVNNLEDILKNINKLSDIKT